MRGHHGTLNKSPCVAGLMEAREFCDNLVVLRVFLLVRTF